MTESLSIALIRPPRLIARSAVNTNTIAPPLNVAYLAGALVEHGFAPVVIDACGLAPDVLRPLEDLPYLVQGLPFQELIARMPAGVRLIGVSCMFSSEWYLHLQLFAALRAAFPDALLVAGGEHASAEPETSMRACPALDVIVRGEGEDTLVALAEALAAGGPIDDIPGTIVRTPGARIRRTATRERIRAVDGIRWPDWSGIPVTTYLDRCCAMDEQVRRTLPMLASRGCPYQCTFCSNPNMWGVNWFARSPEDIVDEIAHYKRTYGIDHVEFYDLTTILDRRWVLRFTRTLIDRRLGISWTMPPGTRSEALDGDLVRLLAESGCTGITFAAESGSPETLKQIKKKVDLRRMLASMSHAVRSGLLVKTNVIFGLPDQTLRDGWQTLRFAIRAALAGASDLLVFPFNPYPGSELYRRLVAEGRIDPEAPGHPRFLLSADYGNTRAVRSWSEHLSARQVFLVSVTTMALFYGVQMVRRPQRIVRMLVNIFRGRPVTWIERMLLGQARRRRYQRATARRSLATATG